MNRWRNPTVVVFACALLASIVIHIEAFGVIDVVSMWTNFFRAPPRVAQAGPSEIEFELADPTQPLPEVGETGSETHEDLAPTTPPPVARREREREQPPPPRPEPTPARPTPPPVPQLVPPPTQETPPPPPPPQSELQSVRQHSNDPSVPPPPNPQFQADENSRVDEETVARMRNNQRDDVEQHAGPSNQTTTPEEGNANDSRSADLREMEGSPDRQATPQEAEAARPVHASTDPMPHVQAAGDTTSEGRPGSDQIRTDSPLAREAGLAPQVGGGDREPEEIVINDPMGSFTIRAPRARGNGLASHGGFTRQGSGLANFGLGTGEGGRHGQRGHGRGNTAEGPDLRVSWSVLEDTYTPDQLNREREAYVEERRSRIRGGARERRWREFRSAIENYVPNVRPGNQTALNAAASPFANYLSDVHRRIHEQFAERFIPNLPGNMGEFADRSLMTNLEIIFNQDGTIHRVGVVQTSGYLPFDYGAFEAVMRGQPYPAAPSSILSGDGRVYIHWAFYRNERQCGTFNAEPYILPNPPESAPSVHDGMFQDAPANGAVIRGSNRTRPAPGGRVPSDAVPSDAPPSGGESEESPPPSREPTRNEDEEPPARGVDGAPGGVIGLHEIPNGSSWNHDRFRHG